MSMMASQITSLTIVYPTVYRGTDQRKHQSSASLAFPRGFHRWPVKSPHKWPVTRKMFPSDDVIMMRKIFVKNIQKHDIKTLSALRALGNPPFCGWFPSYGPVIPIVYTFCVSSLNELLTNQYSCFFRRHDACVMPLQRMQSIKNNTVCAAFLYKVHRLKNPLYLYIWMSDLKNDNARWKGESFTIHFFKTKSPRSNSPWWRHETKTFSALLAICEGNPPVTGGFPSQRPVTRSFDAFFDVRLKKRLYSERPRGAGFRSVNPAERWRENPARALARAGFSQHLECGIHRSESSPEGSFALIPRPVARWTKTTP